MSMFKDGPRPNCTCVNGGLLGLSVSRNQSTMYVSSKWVLYGNEKEELHQMFIVLDPLGFIFWVLERNNSYARKNLFKF